MTLDDRTLREAWAERPEGEALGCPDAEQLLRVAEGAASGEEVEFLAEHAVRCAACAEAWRVAAGLIEAMPAAGEADGRRAHRRAPARVPRRARRSRWLPSSLVAAALVLCAAALSLVVMEGPGEPEVVLREAPAEAPRSLLEEGAALPREDFVLRWSPGPEGSVYDVEVGSGGLELLARARALEAPRFEVPPEALEELPAGARVTWRVEAVLPEGRRLSSITHVNRVR